MVLGSGFILSGCASLRDSIILGAGSGAMLGGIAGNQADGNKEENVIKGAVIGGVILGLAGYLVHGSLEKRDANVRRETLMNLEKYEVLGFEGLGSSSPGPTSGKCFTSKEVDGRVVSIPCALVNDHEDAD